MQADVSLRPTLPGPDPWTTGASNVQLELNNETAAADNTGPRQSGE
jgi:hypothetical protein